VSTSKREVQRWVDDFVAAWRSRDPEAITDLFTADATYAHSPWKEPLQGVEAIVEDWLAELDPPGSWQAEYEAAYVAGNVAIVKGRTEYPEEGRTYANLFEVEFEDGRCSSLVEWHMRMPAAK
jgi:uncharacterized protein (TIGR02246 family)